MTTRSYNQFCALASALDVVGERLGLFTGQIKPDEAIAGGFIRIEGDPGALSRFFSFCQVPRP
jgi:hypothetical protein